MPILHQFKTNYCVSPGEKFTHLISQSKECNTLKKIKDFLVNNPHISHLLQTQILHMLEHNSWPELMRHNNPAIYLRQILSSSNNKTSWVDIIAKKGAQPSLTIS
jgi:hypothetical protein